MYRISLVLASLALVFGGTKASAHVGGPFDNGDYSIALDNAGIYQVAMRFSNGSGFAQFANNANPSLFVPTVGGGTTVQGNAFSVTNRSIIYYKGMTFLGTCMGMVDHERKFVHGVTNGNSDVTTALAAGGGVGGTGGVNPTVAPQTLLNNGNVGFPANSSFTCKITNTYPVLRYVGTGELTVINPSLAQAAFNDITAEITALSVGAAPTPATVATYIANIQALTAAGSELIASLESIRKNSDHVRMNVFGSRIFMISTR